jgi:hypothetical protein
MPVTADKSAPYAPITAITGLIERYRTRGLPTPVDGGVLERAGVSGSLVPRTLQALQTLDLINEQGLPTDTFEAIRLAPESEYQKRLEGWLKGAYAEVFSFIDPTKDDETAIRDAFRGYQPVGQQSRMIALFQGLCKAAGLMPEKTARSTQPRPAAAPSIRRAATPGVRQTFSYGKSRPAPQAAGSLPAPLAGLLSTLPPQGKGWTAESRQKFMTAFNAMLDFCFPVVEHEEEEADETKTATTKKAAAAS